MRPISLRLPSRKPRSPRRRPKERHERMIADTQDAEPAVELDSGPHARERARLCAATRTVQPVSELIRFVVGPDGEAVPDVKNKLPGRGIWITATRDALGEAIKRKAFARGSSGRFACRRTSSTAPKSSSNGRFSMRWPSPARPDWSRQASPRPRRPWPARRVVGSSACAEASSEGVRKLDASMRRRPGRNARGDWIPDLGAIGFGIEPPKCGTCSAARRSRERNRFGALPAP
jgi:predicted RNA-binding protein YlxR (DUF448 family)